MAKEKKKCGVKPKYGEKTAMYTKRIPISLHPAIDRLLENFKEAKREK